MGYGTIVIALLMAVVLTGMAMGQTGENGASKPAASQPASKPAVKITISKETTFLLGPLRLDGTVNYAAAIKEKFSKDVTSDNNAAVLIVKAVGPGAISTTNLLVAGSDKYRLLVLKALRLQDLPMKGDYLVNAEGFLKIEPAAAATMPASAPSDLDQFYGPSSNIIQARDTCATQPWSPDKQPMLAKWVKVNEKPLDTLVQASKLPTFYYPIVSEDEPLAASLLLPPLSPIREGTRMLAVRAMLKSEQGDIEGALADLLAMHKLSRLIEQYPMLINQLVAVAIDSLACNAEQAIAISVKLTSKQAMDFQAQLGALPKLGNMPEAIHFTERVFWLDAIQRFATSSPSAREAVGMDPQRYSQLIARTDWDLVMRRANLLLDIAVAEAKDPLSAGGKAAGAQITKISEAATKGTLSAELFEKVGRLKGKASDEKIAEMVNSAIASKSDKEVTELACNYVESEITTTVLSLSRAYQLLSESQMRMELTRLAFSLAAYKVENGNYPAELSALVPAYIKAVPQDIFTGGALVYKLQGNGYLMYSVGANKKDEGGKREMNAPAIRGGLPQFTDDIAVQAEK